MKKRNLLILAMLFSLGCLGLQGTAYSQDEKKEEAAESEDAGRYAKLLKEFNQIMAGWTQKVQEANKEMRGADPAARAEINKRMTAAQAELMLSINQVGEQMIALAESKEKEVAFDAISWILGSPYVRDAKIKAAATAKISDHLDNPKLKALLPQIGRGLPSQATEDPYRSIAEKSTDPSMQGLATVTLASYLRNNKKTVSSMLGNPAFARAYPDSIDYFKKLAATEDSVVEGLLKTAAEKYADAPYQRGQTIGEYAARELKIMEIQKNLEVGKVAPEIEGPDIDGVNFKLSDYRGKVVMLDFWGDW